MPVRTLVVGVYEHYVAENPEFFTLFGLSRADYAPGEGAVPIRVRGALVGVLAISGLESGGDHDLAVSGLRGPRCDPVTPPPGTR